MPALTTEGLILKRKNFGEADRVLTVLTSRYGKISVIAKGVRRITSRRAGNVELLNRVKLHLFKSRNYTLTEAESLETFRKLKENLTLSTAAFHILELVDRLTAEEQRNFRVYELTIELLRVLEENPRQIFIRSYEVKLLSLLGFWSIDAIQDLNDPISKLLEKLELESWHNINEINITEDHAQTLEKMLRLYIERILESKLKSSQIFKKLKNG